MNFSLIIPAYNEGSHLDVVVRKFHQSIQSVESNFEIVVVNNGSTDNTSSVAEQLIQEMPEVRVVHVPVNRGYGFGILSGLAASTGSILGFAHGDDQVKPEYVIDLYQKMRNGEYDVGKVKRIERQDPGWRLFQSVAYNWLFRFMFGPNNSDVNGSPKLMTRSFYEKADLVSKRWFIDPEIMLKAHAVKARIIEIDILWDSRKGGASKVRFATMFEFLWKMLEYRFLGRIS